MEPFNQRRISDVSFTIDDNFNVNDGNRSFLKLFDITDPHINLADFLDESDCKNFKCFLDNFLKIESSSLNPYFIANIIPNKNKRKKTEKKNSKSCLFYVEKNTELKDGIFFNIDLKELAYSKVLLDKALLESREYTALLQNFDAFYFVYDGVEFILKNTKDANIIFHGNSEEFKEYFTNNFNIDMDLEDSSTQFDSMVNECLSFTANKIYNFLQNDKKLVTVHTVKTSTRNKSSIIASITHGKERGLMQNLYSETKDGLTGLYNKKAITELATRKVNEAKNPVALIIMDVDKFKEFNDTYGHAFGDKVLVAVSQCIKEAINGVGIAGRIGGDEFLLIIDKTDEEEIRNITRNIRTGIQWSITAADPSSVVTCSMGIARHPLNASNYDELFKIADKSLYIAKNNGRNCYVIYKPEVHDSIIMNNEKNAKSLSMGEYFQKSSESEYEILELLQKSDKDSIDEAVKKLVDYIQVNKITVYDKDFNIISESEKLTQSTHVALGNIREEYLKDSKMYFKFFNNSNFLHLDNTNVLDTLDKTKYEMYHNNKISSTLEVKKDNSLVCFDLYRPARTFPKEKIIFALLAAKIISEKI